MATAGSLGMQWPPGGVALTNLFSAQAGAQMGGGALSSLFPAQAGAQAGGGALTNLFPARAGSQPPLGSLLPLSLSSHQPPAVIHPPFNQPVGGSLPQAFVSLLGQQQQQAGLLSSLLMSGASGLAPRTGGAQHHQPVGGSLATAALLKQLLGAMAPHATTATAASVSAGNLPTAPALHIAPAVATAPPAPLVGAAAAQPGGESTVQRNIMLDLSRDLPGAG